MRARPLGSYSSNDVPDWLRAGLPPLDDFLTVSALELFNHATKLTGLVARLAGRAEA
jgi:hypothetical protein